MKAAQLPISLWEGFRSGCHGQNITVTRQHSIVKSFTTASRLRAGIAASEIKFSKSTIGDELSKSERDQKEYHVRVVPESSSYFTTQPSFTDDYLILQRLLKKYATLPTVPSTEAPKAAWRALPDYRRMVGEAVRASEYSKVRAILVRLNLIHPSIVPPEVAEKLAVYKKDINPFQNFTKPIPIDRFGRALGVGRRKSSTAQAWVLEGTGEVLINGKTLAETFARVHDRESAIWALKSTDRIDKYNVWALVSGGGTTGQAEAMTLAVAKALIAHEPALKPALRRAGCVTRDPRKVERKKAGHVKARKMPAWVKR